jgi:hypothetical protein
MKSRIVIANITIGTTIAIFAALTLSSYGLTSLVSAQEPMTVIVNLTGGEEVPPVQTEATGIAEFTPMGMDSIGYNLNATNIEGATAGRKWTCSGYIIQI